MTKIEFNDRSSCTLLWSPFASLIEVKFQALVVPLCCSGCLQPVSSGVADSLKGFESNYLLWVVKCSLVGL